MQLPNPLAFVSGLLLLGASTGNAKNIVATRAVCGGPVPAQGTEGFNTYVKICGRDNHIERAEGPVKKGKKINCELLLSKGEVNCDGLSKKACDLLDWLHAGCKKAPQCATSSGPAAKKCCDDAERLPFGGGVYYEGYMRACAPHYELKRFDRPVFNDVQCNSLEKFVCQFGMNKYFCDMRDWEKAGCDQRAVCETQNKLDGLPECCQERSMPEGLFREFYRNRYDQQCLPK